MPSFWWNFRHWLHRKLSNDNFRCSQWRKIHQHGFSVLRTLLLPCRCHCSLDGSNSAVESETKLVVRNKWIPRVWSWLEPDSIIGFSVWLNLTPKNRNVSFWWAYRFVVRSNIRLFGLSWCQWQQDKIMMTSSNGNIFRVTGPLWGESTGHRWIPRTKAMQWRGNLMFSLIRAWRNG